MLDRLLSLPSFPPHPPGWHIFSYASPIQQTHGSGFAVAVALAMLVPFPPCLELSGSNKFSHEEEATNANITPKRGHHRVQTLEAENTALAQQLQTVTVDGTRVLSDVEFDVRANIRVLVEFCH